jgi:hypothetical protein
MRVVNVPVDELLSAQIWQHKLCATLSASVNINYRLPIKVYYRICTLRHIRIEIIHGRMSHTIYAAKFEQTIIHQHVHLGRESQSY